jgi:hypothetical protein
VPDDERLLRTAEDREAFGELYDRHVTAVLSELGRRGLATGGDGVQEDEVGLLDRGFPKLELTYADGAARVAETP